MTGTEGSLRFPVVLVGFMGAGKTVVGWHLARRLGARFHDLDQVIEQRAGCPIAEIFQTAGEAAFREQERLLLAEFLGWPDRPAVLATGGGVVEDPANRQALREHGTTIFLDPPFRALLGRIRLAGPGRPLADGATDGALRDRWRARRPLYREVAAWAVTGSHPIEPLAERLARRLLRSV